MTFTRRLILRESVFNAHRTHLYQILAGTFSTREKGHRITSLLFGCLSLLGVGLYLSSGPIWAKFAVIGGVWVSLVAWTYGIRRPSVESALLLQKPVPKNTVPDLKGFDIFLSPPEITNLEYKMVAEAFDSGYIAPVGPQVIEFEKKLSTYLEMEEVHAVSSGTAAIHLGLRALGVGPGDCVLCPDLTFIASCNPVRYLGAEPVLVDVDPATWAMDPDLAREAIRTLKSEGRIVRAMIVVHALGIPAPMPELVQVAREAGVLVMEDCAGAFGTKISGTCVGNFGDVAVYSFNGNKVLTTSGGGALYIKDKNLRASARSWANQGKRSGVVGYEHDTLGYNYKLSNICAAVGLAQLETLGDRLQRKKALYESYRQCFTGIPEVRYMPEPDYGMGNYWLSNIGLDSRAQASDVVYALRQERIEASPLWKPMHLQTLNQDLRYFGGDASSMIHNRYLSLPSGTNLTGEQIEKIASIVRSHLPVVV
jgi:pyridoxal phosphate-dependent aminotransferase EpsN